MCRVCLAPGMVLGLADPGRREGSAAARSLGASPGPRAVGLSTRSSDSGRKTDILTRPRLTGMADEADQGWEQEPSLATVTLQKLR